MTTIATSTAAITAKVMICIIRRSASLRCDQSWCAFQERPHELGRDLRDDCIAITAQSSHSAGNPISQRECAGFNAVLSERLVIFPAAKNAARIRESTRQTARAISRRTSAKSYIPSRDIGVGHPIKPSPLVRRARARSAQIGGPDGISQSFQVSTYSGEPFTSILARNLLSKDRCRAALGDETVKIGPEVSFVGMAFVLSCARKRLTGTAPGPGFAICGPTGEAECVGPTADAGKEMALPKRSKVVGSDIDDAALIDIAGGDMPGSGKVLEPLRSIAVNLVIIGWHAATAPPPASGARLTSC